MDWSPSHMWGWGRALWDVSIILHSSPRVSSTWASSSLLYVPKTTLVAANPQLAVTSKVVPRTSPSAVNVDLQLTNTQRLVTSKVTQNCSSKVYSKVAHVELHQEQRRTKRRASPETWQHVARETPWMGRACRILAATPIKRVLYPRSLS